MTEARELPKVGKQEAKALRAVAAFYGHWDQEYRFFRDVAKRSGLTKIQARRAIRALARKGLAEYSQVWNEDTDMIAGSGYRCTKKGKEVADTLAQARKDGGE